MKLTFEPRGWSDYLHWQTSDPKIAARINEMIRDTMRSPFRGIGKPEPLRENLSKLWSRRITEEHRFVYRVSGKGEDQILEVAQCRFHYRS